MAPLSNPELHATIDTFSAKERTAQAIQWLIENPTETSATAARIHQIKNEATLRMTWYRARKKLQRGVDPLKESTNQGGQNRVLTAEEQISMIRYAEDRATEGGGGSYKTIHIRCDHFHSIWPRQTPSYSALVPGLAEKHTRSTEDMYETGSDYQSASRGTSRREPSNYFPISSGVLIHEPILSGDVFGLAKTDEQYRPPSQLQRDVAGSVIDSKERVMMGWASIYLRRASDQMLPRSPTS